MTPRRTLELAVLGLLHDSPLHGYELRKRLNLLVGWHRLLSYGSLYPALKRLLRAGLVTEDATADPGVSRRQRIVYRITEDGRARFAGELHDVGPAAWEDEDFAARFAFFSRIDVDVRLRVLEGRRTRLQERLDRVSSHRTGTGPVDRYVSELHRHSVESVERELRWLNDLIEAEHRSRQGPAADHEVPPAAPRTSTNTTSTTTSTSTSTES